jgi:hypothetical protein
MQIFRRNYKLKYLQPCYKVFAISIVHIQYENNLINLTSSGFKTDTCRRYHQKNRKEFHRLGKIFVLIKTDKGQISNLYKEVLQRKKLEKCKKWSEN